MYFLSDSHVKLGALQCQVKAKGAECMINMLVKTPGALMVNAFMGFFLQYKALVITCSVILLLIVNIFIRIRRRKKRKEKEREERIVRPVTDVIGTNPEHLAEINRDLKPFGFAYDPREDIFYSIMDAWQRKYGYCRLYDEACTLFSMVIDCEPIPFKYNGINWLIEFWKGQYGMTTGCEVGIYYTTGPNLNIPGVFNGTFYHAVRDEDRINMSFALKKKGNLMFTRSAYHWWITGFKLGEFSDPDELSMDIILDLLDRRMAYAFAEALMKIGYTNEEFGLNGRRVYVRFTKPHTSQPITRTKLTESIAQKNNRSFCDSYNKLTEAYTDTLDKLEIVRNEDPDMYGKILNMGKPRKVYEAYEQIKGYDKAYEQIKGYDKEQ